jgi:hypothetical protein
MLPAEKLGPAATALREQARARGRAEPEIVVRRGLKLDDAGAARARLEAARAAGATYLILDLGRYADELEFVRRSEAFMTRVAR